jgi:hypothetical protein
MERGAGPFQACCHDLVLAGEQLVHRALGHAGRPAQRLDPGGDAVAIEEGAGGLELFAERHARNANGVAAPNQFVDVDGRRIAYRPIGSGKPVVLCTRFRGNLDLRDPAFLDALADRGFRVVTFDYSGLGLSTGQKSYDVRALARDAGDLIEALELRDVVVGGWSIGGMAAQVALAMFPDRISHLALLATTPPGSLVKPAE